MFAQQSAPGAVIPNADTWDGYQASREHLFDMIERIKVNNSRC
jgi:phosphodiesterase/alkaline phosphatase D-like protein